MAPRRGTRTRTTPATTTATATTPMTDAAIRALIAQGVADALAGRTIQINTNLNDDGSQGSGSGITRPMHPTREMETVFHISNCAVENQVKFATCTLHGVASRTRGKILAKLTLQGTGRRNITAGPSRCVLNATIIMMVHVPPNATGAP
ncbi:hypothetical protein Tco_0195967 [Tanacetum coccineum]